MKVSIECTPQFRRQVQAVIYQLVPATTLKQLPKPFDEDIPKNTIKINDDGKPSKAITADACVLVYAQKHGGTYNLWTSRALGVGKRSAKDTGATFEKGEVHYHYDSDTNTVTLDLPNIDESINAQQNLFDELDPSLVGKRKVRLMEKNPIAKYICSDKFGEYRAQRLVTLEGMRLSPLDKVMYGIKKDGVSVDKDSFKKWFSRCLGVNENTLNAVIVGMVGDSPFFDTALYADYPAIVERYIDRDPNEFMSDFNYLESEDDVWLFLQLPRLLVEAQAVGTGEFDGADIIIGRKYYEAGNKSEMSLKEVEQLHNSILACIEGKDLAPETQKLLIGCLRRKEIAINDAIMPAQLTFMTGYENTELKDDLEVSKPNVDVSKWYKVMEGEADSNEENFAVMFMKIYTSLFEAGFVKSPAGVLCCGRADETPVLITRAPQGIGEEGFDDRNWVDSRKLSPDLGRKMGELYLAVPEAREDVSLFTLFTRGIQSKTLYEQVTDKNNNGSISMLCEDGSDCPWVSLGTTHTKMVEEMFRNFQTDPARYTYLPLLMAEFAYGMSLESGLFKGMNVGWSKYVKYIQKTVLKLYREAGAVVLRETAKQKYISEKRLTKNATVEEVTLEAEKDKLFDRKNKNRMNKLLDASTNLLSQFRDYLQTSMCICSLLRVHQRSVDGKKMIQYRVRLSDPMNIVEVGNTPHENLATLFSRKQYHNLGTGIEGREILPEEVVTPSGLGHITHIFEVGDLYDSNQVEGMPVFAYKEAHQNMANGYYPAWYGMPLGRLFDGQPVLNDESKFYGNVWHYILAGSRSGKGVMTLTQLAGAVLNGKTIVYLDDKPDMYSTLVSMMAVCGQTDPKKYAIINGGRVQKMLDKPLEAEGANAPKPFMDRFKNSVLGEGNDWKDWVATDTGKKLIPEYTYPFYNEGAWESGFGDMAYYRLYTLLSGIIMSRVLSKSKEDELGTKFGDMVFIVDEFNEFLNGFNEICKKLKAVVMVSEGKATDELNKAINRAIEANDKKKEKTNEAELTAKVKKQFFKSHAIQVGPVNSYSALFFETVARGVYEVQSLVNAGGVGGTMPPYLTDCFDMYIIGQHPNMKCIRREIGLGDAGVDSIIGTRYTTLGGSGSGRGVTGSKDNIQPDTRLIPPTWTQFTSGNGTDACFGYNVEHPHVMMANNHSSPASSKLTISARYFAYLHDFKIKMEMPLFEKDIKQMTDADNKEMMKYARKATYIKPYLILNDNAHAYTDGLTDNAVVSSHVSKESLFTNFGDADTVAKILDQPVENRTNSHLCHTESELSKMQDGDIAVGYDDGVGLRGYIQEMCDTLQGRTPDEIGFVPPTSADEAIRHSFESGADMLQFAVDKLGYKGSWIEFISDMRPSWFFTPRDVADAIVDGVTETRCLCVGSRIANGLKVKPTWIDRYYRSMSDYPEAFADVYTEDYTGVEGDSSVEQLPESDHVVEQQETVTEKSILSVGSGNKPVGYEGVDVSAYVTGGTQTKQTEDVVTSNPISSSTVDLPKSTTGDEPIIQQTLDEFTKGKETFTKEDLAKIFDNMLMQILNRPEVLDRVYKTTGKEQVATTCSQAIEDMDKPPFYLQTESRQAFQTHKNDYYTLMNATAMSPEYEIRIQSEIAVVLGKDLMPVITGAVFTECRKNWGNLKYLTVSPDGLLKVNGRTLDTRYVAIKGQQIDPSVESELDEGLVAKYFDYRYISSGRCKNLEVLVFGSVQYTNQYIAPIMGMQGGVNIETLFHKLPSLKKIYLEDRCFTRERYKKQCQEDYTNNDYAGDVLDNLRYVMIEKRNGQWSAMRQSFGKIPEQLGKGSNWQKVKTFASAVMHGALGTLAGLGGLGAGALASGNRALQNTYDNRQEQRKKNGWGR